MGIIDTIAERRIAEAVARGDLADLPGQGRPLRLDDDDALVLPELRMAYKVLKNAGFLPPEIELRNEIYGIHELMCCVEDETEHERLSGRLQLLMMRLSAMRPGASLELESRYLAQINRRLGRAGD